MARILIVEDDRQLSCLLVEWLTGEGHVPEPVYNGIDALKRLQSYEYDTVVLDWMMPGLSGVDLCRQYRLEGGKTPILMLTGKSEVEDVERGLDSGADAYLTKPFHMKELSARLRALLRGFPPVSRAVLKAGALSLNPGNRQVLSHDEDIDLQPKEFALLEFFLRHPLQPFSPQVILERVWSSDAKPAPETLRIHIMRLRNKIDVAGRESMIRTIHRVGYMFIPPQPELQAEM
jgi:DNA-binding response OmpR family regulator